MSDVRRAAAFAAVGVLSLVAAAAAGQPDARVAAVVAAAPFLLVAGFALAVAGPDGPLFDLFARRTDYEEGRLFGLGGFALAGAGLAALAAGSSLPPVAFAVSVFALVGGTVGAAVVEARRPHEFLATAVFAGVGFAWGLVGGLAALGVGYGVTDLSYPPEAVPAPTLVFLAATAAVAAALLRTVLFARDDPLVTVSVALVLWLFAGLEVTVPPTRLGVGLAVTVLLGYVAYALGTASVAGMLTGVLLALFAIVLGGYGWFALLVTFFGLGGLASKYRYDEKTDRGIAEANEGARGSGNVLANSAAALAAVVAFTASEGMAPAYAPVFRFAFAGAVAAALADTFSSEFGGLFDAPRLVTTFERVEPGTDGAVTWQGEVAGLAGAALIAGIAALFFELGPVAAGLVVLGGFVGMTVDSLLGATLEGGRVGNQGVNFLATLSGAVACGALSWLL
ncbi:DUF92 domain-containing protein [Halosegnis marinus]|uniref:DUF92 domain-containing protein n=1 Tax=Halosegnis marinus TaxID=3034023 RepID=A0ABD5ZLN5_9EURY|nr:DUF92 domain-containing protein [Halosegnis sp. DT85]